MSVALDTNVLQALLVENHPSQAKAAEALKRWQGARQFVISPFVYAEAHGIPGFHPTTFANFLQDVGIRVDTTLPDTLWQQAGVAHAAHHLQRKRQGHTEPRRILTDFLIGAHALGIEASLLTFNTKGYRTAFPSLELLP